jgi:hypothetical protein
MSRMRSLAERQVQASDTECRNTNSQMYVLLRLMQPCALRATAFCMLEENSNKICHPFRDPSSAITLFR